MSLATNLTASGSPNFAMQASNSLYKLKFGSIFFCTISLYSSNATSPFPELQRQCTTVL
uniref:Uncharacterized protein n=1 Tax=Rhizophora mucronata TaxID=61149 RepID=A0A2P2IYY4_RHIMU